MKAVEVDLATRDPARVVTERFLQALSRKSNEEGLAMLLGGATLVSRLYRIDDWKIVGREKKKIETGDFPSARSQLAAFDRERRRAHGELIADPEPPPKDEVAARHVTTADAAWTFELVRARSKVLMESNPVFAFLAGVDQIEEGYLVDPFRRFLAKVPPAGKYALELDQFWIESMEGHHQEKLKRVWPLWVLRLRVGRLDSGMKVLPTTETTGSSSAEICR
ncbi:MAG: hypothetical protein HY901_05600 [Deltaproteobacteria bacterium]|nr:hypothetical protein [Deltaproteobacteria bacterium]